MKIHIIQLPSFASKQWSLFLWDILGIPLPVPRRIEAEIVNWGPLLDIQEDNK